MAAEKEGKFQDRIFSSFFRRFHYAYNILDDRQDYVKKKKEERCNLNLGLLLRSSLRILFRGLLQRKQLLSQEQSDKNI